MSRFKVMATCDTTGPSRCGELKASHLYRQLKAFARMVVSGLTGAIVLWRQGPWTSHPEDILAVLQSQSLLKSHHPGSGWMKLLFLYRLYQDAYNLPAKGNSHLISHLFWCYLFSGHLLSLKFNWVFVFPVSPRRLAGTKQSSWGQQLFIWKEEKIYS